MTPKATSFAFPFNSPPHFIALKSIRLLFILPLEEPSRAGNFERHKRRIGWPCHHTAHNIFERKDSFTWIHLQSVWDNAQRVAPNTKCWRTSGKTKSLSTKGLFLHLTPDRRQDPRIKVTAQFLKHESDNLVMSPANLHKGVDKDSKYYAQCLHNAIVKGGLRLHFIFYFHKGNDRIPELHVPFRKKHVPGCSPSLTGKSICAIT